MTILNFKLTPKSINKNDYNYSNFFIVNLKNNDIVFDTRIHKKTKEEDFLAKLESSPIREHFEKTSDIYNNFNFKELIEEDPFAPLLDVTKRFNLAEKGFLVVLKPTMFIEHVEYQNAVKEREDSIKNNSEKLVEYLAQKTIIPKSDILFVLKNKNSLDLESIYSFIKSIFKMNEKMKQKCIVNS